MKTTSSRLLFALASTALLIAGCDGDGGEGASTSAPAPSSILSSVPVTVIDGVITNATVCLDKNLNGACDSGEPSGRTDSSGNVILQVEPADVGKYPILAIVGNDAVDADHGPVTQAFVMKAPADQTAVISPLTTLVQTAIDSTGASTAAAETSVKAQLGINVSLFGDFTKSTSTDSTTAGAIARMIVVATQEQSGVLAPAVGTTAMDGTVITQAAVNKAIEQKMLQNLTSLVTAASDSRILAAATPQDKAKAVAAVIKELVAAADTGLTVTAMATVVAINNQIAGGAPTVETPIASVSLRQLNFTDAANWFARVFTSTIAQNTPDSSGNIRFVDRRIRKDSNTTATWNTGSEPARQADLHWNGAQWANCGFNAENVSSVRDAKGRSTYDYCDKLETGTSTRAGFDVSGRKMINVYNELTKAGFANLTIASAPAVLGSAVFPAGSKVYYQTSAALATAPAYSLGSSNILMNTRADIAAGKTSAADTASACASISPSTPPSSYQTSAKTLESVIAANRGTPCVYGPATASVVCVQAPCPPLVLSERDDWWGQSSVSIGSIGTAAVGPVSTLSPFDTFNFSYFTTNTLLRVAFGAGDTVKYLSCKQRQSDGSPRNCDPIGTGTYTVTTLGDARILTLNNLPAQTASLAYNRVFVERGGKVYSGYQNKPLVTNTARLNKEATHALIGQLDSSQEPINPDVPLTLTTASYQGDWVIDENLTTIRLFGSGAAAQCLSNAVYPSMAAACPVSLTPASGAITSVFNDGMFSGTLNFITREVSGTFYPTVPAPPREDHNVCCIGPSAPL